MEHANKLTRCITGLMAGLLLLSSCSTVQQDTSVADAQGSKVFASVITGIQVEPEDESYTKNYSEPATPFSMVIKPTSLNNGKEQLTNALQQTPARVSIDFSSLNWSEKINLYSWVARTYAAVYNNVQPEYALPMWSTGIARWSAAVWKLNYYDLETWTNAGCPDLKMTRLNYTQGWSFNYCGGGPAWEEYCDRYLSCLNGKSDYQKVQYIIDLVCDQVEYDWNAYNSGSSYQIKQANDIENYFTTNEMCCQGYARIFQALCLHAGLQCYEIVGTAGCCHAWNMVVVDGRKLNVDCCWLDSGDCEYKSVVSYENLPHHYADVRYNGTLNYAV